MEFLALPILILSAYAAYSFSVKPVNAVIFILLASVIDAWFVEPPSVKIGLNIYLNDGVFFLLFISAFVRISFLGQFRHLSPLWVIYGLLLFYGLFEGIKLYGTEAGVDFRNIFYYWTGTLYFMTFNYSNVILDKVRKYWLLLCSILLLIVYFRFVAELLHLPIAATWMKADSGDIRFRVVNAAQAYILGVTIIMLFVRYLIPEGTSKPSKIITVLFIVAVIALQHRSVWAATLFGILSATLLPGIKSSRLLSNIAVIAIVGSILLMPVLYFGYADKLLGMIGKSAERATNLTQGTFGARVKGWEHIINYYQKSSFFSQLFGEPFGSTYAGLKAFPHNFTFQNLLRVGALGTLIFYCTYLLVLGNLYLNIRKDREDKLYSALFFMLLVGQMAYYIPYGPHPEHGIILGIAISLAKRRFASGDSPNRQDVHDNRYFLNIPKITHKAHVASA